MISWSKFLQKMINDFNNKGYAFAHVSELNNITLNNKTNVSFEFYKQHNYMSSINKIIILLFSYIYEY